MENGTLRVVLSRWDTSLLWAGTGTPAPIVGAAIVPTFLGSSYFPREAVPLPQPHSILSKKILAGHRHHRAI